MMDPSIPPAFFSSPAASAGLDPNRTKAPWHQPACPACSSNLVPGFSSKGEPCQICDSMSAQAKRPYSGHFLTMVDDTKIEWQPKPEFAENLAQWGMGPGKVLRTPPQAPKLEQREAPPLAPAAFLQPTPAAAAQAAPAAGAPTPGVWTPPSAQAPAAPAAEPPGWRSAAGSPAPAAQAAPNQVQGVPPSPTAPVIVAGPAPAPATTTTAEVVNPARRGRPAAGFILCIDCHSTISRGTVELAALFQTALDQFAAVGQGSLYQAPAATQGTFLTHIVAQAAAGWKKETIHASSTQDPLYMQLVNLVAGHAAEIYVGHK